MPRPGDASAAYLDGVLLAQDQGLKGRRASSYRAALAEITHGRKRNHWIWYVWPAHAARRETHQPDYSLPSASAALAWLRHGTLGPRFLEITQAACGFVERFDIEPFSDFSAK